MLVSTLTLLATLLPALAASGHNPPPALRHRRLAESANHKARGLIAKPAHLADRANVAHAEAHRAIKKAVKKRDGQTCRARPSTSAASAGASASADVNDAAASASATPYSAAAAPSSTWAAAASSADASPTVDNQQAWAHQVSSTRLLSSDSCRADLVYPNRHLHHPLHQPVRAATVEAVSASASTSTLEACSRSPMGKRHRTILRASCANDPLQSLWLVRLERFAAQRIRRLAQLRSQWRRMEPAPGRLFRSDRGGPRWLGRLCALCSIH